MSGDPISWTVFLAGLALTASTLGYLLTERRRSAEVRSLVEKLSAEVRERRAGEERYRLLIESAPDAIVTLDPEGRFTTMNSSAETLTGRPRHELLNQPFTPLVHSDDLPKVRQALATALAGGRPPAIEIRLLRKAGEVVPMEFTVTPQFEADRVHGVLAIGRDVSARQQSERAQAGLEVQLRRAQKMEALGRLASGIAHDFNNFLAVIMANCQMARMDLIHGHPAVQSVDEINKASERAAGMVRQILAFSRQQSEERVVVDLEPLVHEALKLLGAMLPANISIRTRFSPGSFTVLANPEQIHQVLLNLGTNAAYAMKEKGGHLEVSLSSLHVDDTLSARNRDLRAGPYVRLTVSDNGHGMDAPTLERIFDPFFTTKPPGEGTGLGLAVVHGILKSHEGAITVYSEPGRGTWFNLYFPAVEGEEVRPEASSTPPRGHGQRVLFVDDETSLAESGRRVLERLGYRPTICANAAQALEALRTTAEPFDCIVSDLAMPGMNGLELAAECRRLRPGVPFILMSGNNSVITPESLEASGARDFILKPFTLRALAEMLRAVLPPVN